MAAECQWGIAVDGDPAQCAFARERLADRSDLLPDCPVHDPELRAAADDEFQIRPGADVREQTH